MRLGRLDIEASRWPWQEGYNWRGMTNSTAPLNAGGARFGGGWRWALGFEASRRTVLLNLLYGMVTIKWLRRARCESCERRVGEQHQLHCREFKSRWSPDHWMNRVDG